MRNENAVILGVVAVLLTVVFSAAYFGSRSWEADYGPAPTPPNISISELEQRTFLYVNQQRVDAGLSALEWNGAIAGVARNYSRKMADNNFFAHKDPTDGYHVDRLDAAGIYYLNESGENLLLTSSYKNEETVNGRVVSADYFTMDELAREATNGWMNSTGHRENLLRPEFDESGMGVAVSPDGQKYYFTQVFIARATCGYLDGPCCIIAGYYPSCYNPLRCIGTVCS